MGSLRRSLPPARAVELRRWILTAGDELWQVRIDLFEVLRVQGLADRAASPVAERAALVVTELAGNALRHGRPPAVVRLMQADGCFVIDVADQDRDNLPEPAAAGRTDVGGRGLHIAQSLAGEVFWYRTRHAKHVWVSFPAGPGTGQGADGHREI